jgi:hypothetical protein
MTASSDPDFAIAQLSHVALGALTPMSSRVLWPNSWAAPLVGAGLVLGAAAVKELFVDPKLDPTDTAIEGEVDFSSYVIGAALALGAIYTYNPPPRRPKVNPSGKLVRVISGDRTVYLRCP